MKARYYVYTWDTERQEFSPQPGVRCGPYSLWGLRRAIRKLRNDGYPCDYHGKDGTGDPSVSIQRGSGMTTYKDVLNFPDYRVGDDGSVWTRKAKGGNDRRPGRTTSWRLLSVNIDDNGYRHVNLDRDGKNYSRLVHQLVLEAFVGPCPDGMEGCHYPDSDKGNNALANLRWDTHAENMKDAYRDRGPVTEKRCRRCGETKASGEFYGDSRASDGLKTECKSCHVETAKKSRDPEKKRAANREWMRRHRKAASVG